MKERWKIQALEFCIEIFEDYTRAEISRFSSGVQRAWKVGKRASASSTNKKLQMDAKPCSGCGCTGSHNPLCMHIKEPCAYCEGWSKIGRANFCERCGRALND